MKHEVSALENRLSFCFVLSDAGKVTDYIVLKEKIKIIRNSRTFCEMHSKDT